ncbi:MAG: hypothetical protein ACXIUQ_04295 [Cecembia sp.]
MEDEGLKKDPNWKGETPAFKISLKKNNSFASILNGLKEKKMEVFMVSDEYAMKNPTIVFGAFDEGLYDRELKLKEARVSEANLSYTNVIPWLAGIRCNQVQQNDLVRWMMPQLRIRDNTKGWPSGNYISIWVAFGAYNLNQGGTPSLGFSANQIIKEKKINRGDFDWKSNFPNMPLLTHWHETNLSVQIIIAYQRKGHTMRQNVSSASVNPNTGATTNSSVQITQSHTLVYGTNHWYRCQEINGAHLIQSNPALGTIGGNAIWEMTGRDGRIQFTLEPRLTRL